MVRWFSSTGKCFSSPHKLNSLIFSHSGWNHLKIIFSTELQGLNLLFFYFTLTKTLLFTALIQQHQENAWKNMWKYFQFLSFHWTTLKETSFVLVFIVSSVLIHCFHAFEINVQRGLLSSLLCESIIWKLHFIHPHKASIENDQTKPKKDLNLLPTKWRWMDVFNT